MMRLLRIIAGYIVPPPAWQLPVIVVLGLSTGVGLVIAHQSRAWSYASDDPGACINCHIMMPQFSTWRHSSHARVASCNDCHVPHTSVAAKYYFKAKDGSRHATLFTLGMERQVIGITRPSKAVVQENCLRCHSELNSEVSTSKVTVANTAHGAGHLCWDCHREVPHGRVNSLSSVPNAGIQLQASKLPEWITKHRKDGAEP